MRFETQAIHAGDRPDTAFGAVSVPTYTVRPALESVEEILALPARVYYAVI